MSNLARLERVVAALPEAGRVDVEAWGGTPTFRVRGKCFVFANVDATLVSVKLPLPEAQAVVCTEATATPMGYGMGRHGWVSVDVGSRPSAARWGELAEWVRTSYCMIAPKRLVRLVEEADAAT